MKKLFRSTIYVLFFYMLACAGYKYLQKMNELCENFNNNSNNNNKGPI